MFRQLKVLEEIVKGNSQGVQVMAVLLSRLTGQVRNAKGEIWEILLKLV